MISSLFIGLALGVEGKPHLHYPFNAALKEYHMGPSMSTFFCIRMCEKCLVNCLFLQKTEAGTFVLASAELGFLSNCLNIVVNQDILAILAALAEELAMTLAVSRVIGN